MSDPRKYMLNRLVWLKALRSKLEKQNAALPEGRISLVRSRGKICYYHRTEKSQKRGKYLSKKRLPQLIERLAQKEYCVKACKCVDAEINAINKYVKSCPVNTVENLALEFEPDLWKMITPLVIDDDTYLDNWVKSGFDCLEMESDYMVENSQNGGFRSKSEWMIAVSLSKAEIPFKYEKKLLLGDSVLYPDFTLLDTANRREIYWEHFGMMDDPDYVLSTAKKLMLYSSFGLIQNGQLLVTMEHSQRPIDMSQVELIIEGLKGTSTGQKMVA